MMKRRIKKLIAALLAVTLAFAASVCVAAAQEDKIEPSLRRHMERTDGTLRVHVCLVSPEYGPEYDALMQKITSDYAREHGADALAQVVRDKRALTKLVLEKYNAQMAELIGQYAEIERVSTLAPTMVIVATPSQIEQVASLEQVDYLYYAGILFDKEWSALTDEEKYQRIKYCYNNGEPIAVIDELDQEFAAMTDVVTPARLEQELRDNANTLGFKSFVFDIARYVPCNFDQDLLESIVLNEDNGVALRDTAFEFLDKQSAQWDESVIPALKMLTDDAEIRIATHAIDSLTPFEPAFVQDWTAEKFAALDGEITDESSYYIGARVYVLSNTDASVEECQAFIEQCLEWRDKLMREPVTNADPVFYYHSQIKELLMARGWLGDVNQDGRVTALDARLALRLSAQLEHMDVFSLAAADIDGTNNVTAANARKILRVSAKLESF